MKSIHVVLISIGAFIAGLLICNICGLGYPMMGQAWMGMHAMPDGSMMSNTISMQHMMGSMNDALKGKTGDEFDRAFLSEMIVHHEGAVEMAELAKKNAKHQEIKDLSDAIISAQEKEIESMKAWQKSWYDL